MCKECTTLADQLIAIQNSEGYGSTLLTVNTSLIQWAKDIPTWDVEEGLHRLTHPIGQRGIRSKLTRKAPFVVVEGVDVSGKTFHMEAVTEVLAKRGFPVRAVTFPNARTPLGRFLKLCLREGRQLGLWTQHVLFSIHRWELMDWIATRLILGEAVVSESYTWSGMVYSWASEPSVDIRQYMATDMGILSPDLVVYIDTHPDKIDLIGVSPLFDNCEFQRQVYNAYENPLIWEGVYVIAHKTTSNKWDSKKSLAQKLNQNFSKHGECESWKYLWEETGICTVCGFEVEPDELYNQCCLCSSKVHYFCTVEDWKSERPPICCACAEGVPPQMKDEPLSDQAIEAGQEQDAETERQGETLDVEFWENLQSTGAVPCPSHGMDHLSKDPNCEHCKKALVPMYRHLSGKYGLRIADGTPTLSFDFSGPLPIAVTGARYMLLFVWRLQQVRLLWAFAVTNRTKEIVLACIQSVMADLRTLTGGSKPPVARVHSDQAKEFLSHKVMEWLKEQGIKQTFTSAYDSQANGVAERWINLVKTKATVLLASRYLHTAFWCYAVTWVARCYNEKVLGQKPRKNLPQFGQLLLVRTKRDNKLQDGGKLGIMAGTYPDIPNGVVVLLVEGNSIKEQYTAHVSTATFDGKSKWFIRRDKKDPTKVVYISDQGEISWDTPVSQLATVEEKLPLKYHPYFATLQRAVDGWAWYTSNVGQLRSYRGRR